MSRWKSSAREDLDQHEWLHEGSERTPDLRLSIGGEAMFVEITMSTSKAEQELLAAAEKIHSPETARKWPQRCDELSYQ